MAKVIHGAISLHSSEESSASAGNGTSGALAPRHETLPSLDDFQAIYREHYPAIWRFVRHLGVWLGDVPDVTHNVFLVAYRKLASFEGRSTVRTWLCGIALRSARDHLRSSPVRREVSVPYDPREDSPQAASFEPPDAHELRLAERLLAALPEEQREVFVLHELEQMSGSEIADLMGTSLGTVRSRLRRARDSFRKQLAETKKRGPHG